MGKDFAKDFPKDFPKGSPCELAAEVWTIAQGMANDRLQSEREALEATRQQMEQQKALIEKDGEALKLAAANEAARTAQAALAGADALAAMLEAAERRAADTEQRE